MLLVVENRDQRMTLMCDLYFVSPTCLLGDVCADINGGVSSASDLIDSSNNVGFRVPISSSASNNHGGAQFDSLDRWNSYENFNDLSASYDSLRVLEGPSRGQNQGICSMYDVVLTGSIGAKID